ncbi:hypothetical protein [Thermococcus barophilus]|uniref:Uncharacterized protein n=1 Tax=Thermococcus barophilus (strain DSM 11836 / MP) TaxID=391623 RepID=F0LLU7_THEBM|nr:hypothetical protein [Thermococcus barophilus]ADT85046.1 hypothetical protein TERMP_02072 [Thermococcus barophilus MP]
MPLAKEDLKVGRSILSRESYYEFTCPFCGAFQKAELKEPINLKIKFPMKRGMKRLLESDTVQLIFYREGGKELEPL